MKMSHWIEPDLVQALAAENTDAYRLCTFADGWAERYADDILISHKNVVALERLTTEVFLWAASVNAKVRQIFARFLPKQNSEREAPRLVKTNGTWPAQTTVMERGLRYGIDFESGYSTGLFLDQRHNRAYLRNLQAKALLNCFAYTCSFSVAAAAAGAKTVSVDLSKKSLMRGRENFVLNEQPLTEHRFITNDVMEYLPRLARKGEKFDAIILDPPTFSRSKIGKAFQVERDFETLLLRAVEVAERDCHILLSTNCSTLDEHALQVMGRFVLKASRRAGTLHRELPLPDFPPGVGASTVWLTLR